MYKPILELLVYSEMLISQTICNKDDSQWYSPHSFQLPQLWAEMS